MVPKGVASLELEYPGRAAIPIPLVERFFLHEIPSEQPPGRLVGRDASGRVVETLRLHPR